MPAEDGRDPDEAAPVGEGEGRRDAPDSRLVVEGLLFSSDKPLRIADIEEATQLERGTVRTALRKLASDYRRRNTALEVVRVGGRWTMQVRSEYTTHVRAVAAPEVPDRLLKTLALIAYHQPVLQSDLQEMLGPKVYDHVRELEALGLVNARRKGSTKELTTSQRFPEYFGIDSARKEDIKRFMAERVGAGAEPMATDVEAGPALEPDAAEEPEPEDAGEAPAPEGDQV